MVGLSAYAVVVVCVFISVGSRDLRVNILGSAVALVSIALLFAQGVTSYRDRRELIAGATNPLKRVVTFLGFSALGIFAATLATISALNAGQLIWSRAHLIERAQLGADLVVWRFIAFHVVAPLSAPVIFVFLSTKVRAVRMLDVQKERIHVMMETINRFQLSPTYLVELEAVGAARPPDPDGTDYYFASLKEICGEALQAASIAGQYEQSQVAGGAAVLYLLDQAEAKLVPVCAFGASAEYKRRVMETPMPLWKHEEFRQVYCDFVDLADKSRTGRTLRDFRHRTKDLVSTVGVVFACNRGLVFSSGQSVQSLINRDEHLLGLTADQRPDYRQVVGLPLFVADRRVGVLLLLTTESFYRGDKVYNTVANALGEFIKVGVALGYFAKFKRHPLPQVISNAPLASDSSEVFEAERIINGIRSDFGQAV